MIKIYDLYGANERLLNARYIITVQEFEFSHGIKTKLIIDMDDEYQACKHEKNRTREVYSKVSFGEFGEIYGRD